MSRVLGNGHALVLRGAERRKALGLPDQSGIDLSAEVVPLVVEITVAAVRVSWLHSEGCDVLFGYV